MQRTDAIADQVRQTDFDLERLARAGVVLSSTIQDLWEIRRQFQKERDFGEAKNQAALIRHHLKNLRVNQQRWRLLRARQVLWSQLLASAALAEDDLAEIVSRRNLPVLGLRPAAE